MAKTTITYNDRDGSAPKTTWHGREFVTGRSIEVDDDRDADLIEAAGGNPWFDVKPGEAPRPDGNTPYDRGGKAAAEGKDRSVPVAWRGKPEGDAWLAGYDDRTKALGKVPPDQVATAGGPVSPSQQANAAGVQPR